MSFGFINDNGLLTPAGFVLSIGIPSITIRGLLLALNDAPPLILILGSESGWPPFEVILTPGAFPVSNWSAEIIAPLLKSFEVIDVNDPVASFFLTVP